MESDFKSRKWLDDKNRRAAELRQAYRGYAGLEGPMLNVQKKLALDFEMSAAIKHAGDKGNAREGIIRQFFDGDGRLPKKYAIAGGSTHIISTTGHISSQTDLLFYDVLNSPRLLSIGGIEYFPVEAVYGVIESKSDLDSKRTIMTD